MISNRHTQLKFARKQLIEVSRLCYARGYICGTEGNFSIRLNNDSVLTTPRGTCKGRIDSDDLVITNLSGEPINTKPPSRHGFGNPLTSVGKSAPEPSTELKMHLTAYQQRPEIKAVVHAHPTFAVGFTVAGVPFDKPILPEIVCTLGKIPIACYATPSTDELPQSISELIKEHDALLLDHHGALTVGLDIWEAFFKLEMLEHYAKTVFVAQLLGGAKSLTSWQVNRLIEIRDIYSSKKSYNK